MYNFKDKIEDYTEREFIELLGEFTNPTGDNAQLKGEELDKYWDDLEEHLTRITQHPLMSDLIYYPAKKGDDKPENILKIVKEWRKSTKNGGVHRGYPCLKTLNKVDNKTIYETSSRLANAMMLIT